MTPILADISQGEIWMIALNAVLALAAIVGIFLKKQEIAVQQPLDVQIIETLVSKEDFGEHKQHMDRELNALWNTVRAENTAIRREITDAVTHSQEIVMDKLESNRIELASKLDGISDRVIATLKNTGAI